MCYLGTTILALFGLKFFGIFSPQMWCKINGPCSFLQMLEHTGLARNLYKECYLRFALRMHNASLCSITFTLRIFVEIAETLHNVGFQTYLSPANEQPSLAYRDHLSQSEITQSVSSAAGKSTVPVLKGHSVMFKCF